MHVDPTDLAAVRQASGLDEPGSALHDVGLERIVIGPEAIEELPGIVAGLGDDEAVAILVDRTPMVRNGLDLKRLVADRLAVEGRNVRLIALGQAGTELHADARTIAEAVAGARGSGVVVGLGSGTICDV